MLHASTSVVSSLSTSPTPASNFFARLHSNHSQRSSTYSGGDVSVDDGSEDGSALGNEEGRAEDDERRGRDTGLRKSYSLRSPGTYGGTFGVNANRYLDFRRDVAGLSSFAAAGTNLSSPTPSVTSHYTPPAASRHPLFAHHAAPPRMETSHSFMSDPGPSGPPSPSESNMSSGAFSPASAFLSHFSSSSSLQAPGPGPSRVPVAPDAQGAHVLDYTLGKILGRGGFSTVRQAIHNRTGEILACKIVKRDDLSDRSGSLERFEDEIRIWQSLPRHPFVLPLLEMHRTPFATFLITPFLPGGSLLDVLKREGGSENTARKWFPGVVAAVAALHEGYEGFGGGMLHGDLKLDNFLVDHHTNIMIGDFGMAQTIGGDGDEMMITVPPPLTGRHSTLPANIHHRPRYSSPFPSTNSVQVPKHHNHHGHHLHHEPEVLHPAQPLPSASLPYAPPELLRAPPARPSLAQDIWATGIILYALLTGKLPFVDSFDPRLQMKILRGHWDVPDRLGHEWQECLAGCLEGDKDRRWNIKQVRDCDAVTGWREVKPRSKSRSRSRAPRDLSRNRLGHGGTHPSHGFDFASRNVGSGDFLSNPAQPLPIVSPSHRNGQASAPSHSRGRPSSRDGGQMSPLMRSSYPGEQNHHPHDVFASSGYFAPPDPSNEGMTPSASGPRSRSASASRSRSSGRGSIAQGMFSFEPHSKGGSRRQDVDTPEEGVLEMDIDEAAPRGRSTGQRRTIESITTRRDRSGSSQNSRQSSRNRVEHFFGVPPASAGLPPKPTFNRNDSSTRHTGVSTSPTESIPGSRARSTSRIRGQDLQLSPVNHLSPLPHPSGSTGIGSWTNFANELHVVDEEGRQGVTPRDMGRSRSRGRQLDMKHLDVVDEEGRIERVSKSGGRSTSRGRMPGRRQE